MADRMTLIIRLGAMAEQAEKRRDSASAATLRETVELLIADRDAADSLERRRKGENKRQKDKRTRDRQSREVTGSHVTSRDVTDHNVTSPQGFPGPLPNSLTTTATSSSPAHAWETDDERRLAESLPTNVGRSALALVLLVVAKNAGMRIGVTGEIDACMSGHRGAQHKATAAQLDVALSDYATNGLSSGRWNADHFRACLRRAVANDQPSEASGAKVTPIDSRPPAREHWTEKKEREDRAAAEQRRICGLVDARRARTSDGDAWWDRMRAAAGTADMRVVYRFALEHIDEPGRLAS